MPYNTFRYCIVYLRCWPEPSPSNVGRFPPSREALPHCKLWKLGRARRLQAKEACSAQRRGVSVRWWTHNSQAVNGGWLPLRESAVMSLPSIQWKPATSVGWLPPDVGQGHHSALTQWKPATIDRLRIVSTIAPTRLAVVLSKPPWLAACALARVSIACSGVVASLDGGKPRIGRAWLGPALQIQRNLLYGTYCACYCISLRESE